MLDFNNQENQNIFARTELLFSNNFSSYQKCIEKKILVIGLGGVGGAIAEFLTRTGCQNLVVCDFDKVSYSNLNRQILYNFEDIGKLKTECANKHLKKINPKIKITELPIELKPDTVAEILNTISADFVFDAIDLLLTKARIIDFCLKNNLQFISALGASSKKDITKIRCGYLEDVSNCAIAKRLKYQLNKLNNRPLKKIPVVYSIESSLKPKIFLDNIDNKKKIVNGSIAHITNTFGAFCVNYFFNIINQSGN